MHRQEEIHREAVENQGVEGEAQKDGRRAKKATLVRLTFQFTIQVNLKKQQQQQQQNYFFYFFLFLKRKLQEAVKSELQQQKGSNS